MTDDEDRVDGFDQALRELAARPPARSPAAAARAIGARIARRPEPAPWRRPGWAWTAAGLIVAVGVAGLLGVRPAPRASAPSVPRGVEAGAAIGVRGGALSEGQVLIWLDAETPLYMNFAPPAGAPADGGRS